MGAKMPKIKLPTIYKQMIVPTTRLSLFITKHYNTTCNYFSILKFYNDKNGNAIPFLLKILNILIEIVICEWWHVTNVSLISFKKKNLVYINTNIYKT
jgi:hypothetical protein